MTSSSTTIPPSSLAAIMATSYSSANSGNYGQATEVCDRVCTISSLTCLWLVRNTND